MALAAAPTDSRFVVIIMRGALDGMAAVVAVWRPGVGQPAPGPDPRRRRHRRRHGRSWRLLRPEPRHAAIPPRCTMPASCCRSTPSPVITAAAAHFEAQDYMESGADQRMTSGWLKPCRAGDGQAPGPEAALAVGMTTPLLMRGRRCWRLGTAQFRRARPDLYARIAALNAGDAITGPAITEALRDRGLLRRHLGWDGEAANAYAFPPSPPWPHACWPPRPAPGSLRSSWAGGTRMPTRCAASPGRWGSWIRVWRR